MTFSIICNNPRGGGLFNETDETLDDAVQSVFELNDEDAELEWNGVVFSLNYKYDLGMMVDDAVSMLKTIIAAAEGNMVIAWVSSGFPFAWKIAWSDDRISLSATSRDSHFGQRILGLEVLETSKKQFVREWQSVLVTIKAKLVAAGYSDRYVSSLRELCGPMLPGQTSG